MVIEINEMIDVLDDFCRNDKHSIVVGGIAGTEIERYTLESVTGVTSWDKVLVLQCCQDYMGLMKEQLPNVIFYGDLFYDEMVDPLIPHDPWRPTIFNMDAEYVTKIRADRIANYEFIVVLNAHLIYEDRWREMIEDNFSGKIIYIVDPIEGRVSTSVPTITDTLMKVSPMIALARAAVQIDTRSVDRKAPGTLNEVNKMSKRSIGKIDDKQYVANDHQLLFEIREKQTQSSVRKNQKVLIGLDQPIISNTNSNGLITLIPGSMLVVKNPNSRPLMTHRVYNSKTEFYMDISYLPDVLLPKSTVPVVAANIITTNEMKLHRFNHTVMCMGDDSYLYPADKYILFKNSNNVTIVSHVK